MRSPVQTLSPGGQHTSPATQHTPGRRREGEGGGGRRRMEEEEEKKGEEVIYNSHATLC